MKKTKLFSALVMVPTFVFTSMVLPVSAVPNTVSITQVRNIGGSDFDEFYSVIQTADGGYIAVGVSRSNDGDFAGLNKGGEKDAVVVKFDGSGNKQWVKDVGGNHEEAFDSVIQTSDGGYIAVGNSNSNDGDFAGLNKGDYDAVVVKLDGSGSIQWVKDIGGSGSDSFSSIKPTTDGGFIVSCGSSSNDGDFANMSKGGEDAVIVKLDGSGNKQWIKDIGGSGDEGIGSISTTTDGGYIAACISTSSDGDFAGMNKGMTDSIIVKFDSNGNTQWMKNIGGSNEDMLNFVIPTSDGGYIAAGSSISTDGDFAGLNKGSFDGVIVKFDSSGSKQWVKTIGGSNFDFIDSFVPTSDGGFIAAGLSGSNDGDFKGLQKGMGDGFVIKLDGSGNRQWAKNIGGSDMDTVSSLIQSSDGGYVAVGYSYSKDGDYAGLNNGNEDAFFVKLSANSVCIPGDVNGDGVVNSKDVTILRRYVAGWNVSINAAAADYNNDGVVNSKDSTLLRRFVAGWKVV